MKQSSYSRIATVLPCEIVFPAVAGIIVPTAVGSVVIITSVIATIITPIIITAIIITTVIIATVIDKATIAATVIIPTTAITRIIWTGRSFYDCLHRITVKTLSRSR